MSLKNWINSLLKKGSESCAWKCDSEGINFVFTQKQSAEIQNGQAEDLLVHQHIALRMLVEQGEAEELPNGFVVPSEVAVHLDENARLLLNLPPVWEGKLQSDIMGKTGRASFRIDLTASNEGNAFTHGFSVEGPLIRFSSDKQHLLSPSQLLIFSALDKHRASDKTEYDNLSLIYAFQQAQDSGASISLKHFEKLNIRAPDAITVEAELDESGRLILTPQMGQTASHERIQKVLGQLSREMATSLRVDDEIILFDEERLAAVREVLRNRIITKDKIKDFLKNPTAFIDASLVDLDLGFSARVKGATHFRHAYFGETDESGIDWFGKKFAPTEVLPPGKLDKVITEKSHIDEFREELEKATKTSAQEVEYKEKVFDVSDIEQVKTVLNEIEDKLSKGRVDEQDHEYLKDESDTDETTVVDILLNDDDLETPSDLLERKIEDVLVAEEVLDWSNYSRTPFPHQVLGTRWIHGLATENKGLGGGLLSDDMGLGKTFMALASIDHLYKNYRLRKKTEKPCLVVAPLSLLQNWADEVEHTFKNSPFRDIIILQSDGQLSDFKIGGAETKNQELSEDQEAEIRYSLKVGKSFANERLDLPKRLVLTTYQTLRDYQFSLCSIDWGMVVFDEAQNIKNPNALQTRAAKGLKADFRLIATGTPVENSLADFWCLMDTACPGYLDTYQAFRDTYITPILRAAGDEIENVRASVGRKLRERVGALMLRRVKEDNLKGLPNKTVYVGMKDQDWTYSPVLHSTLEKGQLESYDSVLEDAANSEVNIALATLQRLRDVSLHPRLVYGGGLNTPNNSVELTNLLKESGKFDSLLSLLNKIKASKEKCIIFVVNKKLQSFLSLALAKTYSLPPISIINGDAKAVAKRASSPTRKSMIKAFEELEGFNIIIMSPVAAGVGLNVVGANNVIHLERHWNPAKEAQATDRVYRIGQEKNVNVFIPLIHHPKFQSFDINLHQLLTRKSLLKDAVITPEQVIPTPGGMKERSWSPTQRITFNDISRLNWQQFEALSAELFLKVNDAENCWLTQNGADYGADVVLTKDGNATLIQCKHTNGRTYDGYRAVTEVYTAKLKYEKELGKSVRELIFATNAVRLGTKTRKTAKEYMVEVVDGKQLQHLLKKHSVTYRDLMNRMNKNRLQV
jgi:SNF2 family DNA or RNA helicase